jgi:hypothetical protein
LATLNVVAHYAGFREADCPDEKLDIEVAPFMI